MDCIAVTVHRNMKMIEEVILVIGGMEATEMALREIELEERGMRGILWDLVQGPALISAGDNPLCTSSSPEAIAEKGIR
jgi:hypothetical protein